MYMDMMHAETVSINARPEDYVQLDLYETDGSTSVIVVHGPNTTAGMEGVLLAAVRRYADKHFSCHPRPEGSDADAKQPTTRATSHDSTVAIGTVSASSSITATVGTITLSSEDLCRAVSDYIIEALTLMVAENAPAP